MEKEHFFVKIMSEKQTNYLTACVFIIYDKLKSYCATSTCNFGCIIFEYLGYVHACMCDYMSSGMAWGDPGLPLGL